MENITQPAKNPLVKIAVIVGGIILLGLFVINFAPTTASQDPLTPPAQAEWEQEKKATTVQMQKLCEKWKDLSKAKGIDAFNGLLKEESRVPEWEANTTVDCSTVEAPLSFTPELNKTPKTVPLFELVHEETVSPEATTLNYDVKKLCKAIGMHETHDCTDKGAGELNNCVGIKPNGKFKKYSTKEDSYADCERIWLKYYQRFPDIKLAGKWSGNDDAQNWLNNVTKFYNKT